MSSFSVEYLLQIWNLQTWRSANHDIPISIRLIFKQAQATSNMISACCMRLKRFSKEKRLNLTFIDTELGRIDS